jgi:hypothetical protein
MTFVSALLVRQPFWLLGGQESGVEHARLQPHLHRDRGELHFHDLELLSKKMLRMEIRT